MVLAVGLLAAGGGIGSGESSDSRTIGRILSLVGYIVFAVILILLMIAALHFWRKKETLLLSSHKVRHQYALTNISQRDSQPPQ